MIIDYFLKGDYTQLLTRREEDTSSDGFKNWTFTTLHFWGTNPNGEFSIALFNNVSTKYESLKIHDLGCKVNLGYSFGNITRE